MCLLAVAKTRLLIPADHLQNAYDHNRDGWGTMYAQDGRVVAFKKDADMTAFNAHWATLPDNAAVAVHFRFGTSGGVKDETCHPFQVLSLEEHGMDLWLMHNGVLYGRFSGSKEESDTQKYVAQMRRVLAGNPELVRNPAWLEDQEDIIGAGSKMVLLEGNGTFHYLNKDQGTDAQDGAVWYSNEYSLKPVYSGHGKGKAAGHEVVVSKTTTYDMEWWQEQYQQQGNANKGYGGNYYAEAARKRSQADWYYDAAHGEWWKPYGAFSYVCMKRDDKGRMTREYAPASGPDYVSGDTLKDRSYQIVKISDVAQFEERPAIIDFGTGGDYVARVEAAIKPAGYFPGDEPQSVPAHDEEKEAGVSDEEYNAQLWSDANLRTLSERELSDMCFEDSDSAAIAIGALLGLAWAFEPEEDAA